MSIIVETYSGKVIDLEDVKPEDIDPIDIAVSLSRQRRYNGHTVIPWTVTQHSVLCSMIADKLNADANNIKACFLHDVEEYLIQDFIAPIKNSNMVNTTKYKDVSNKITKVVFDEFGCHNYNHSFVKTVDQLAYCFEWKAFKANSPLELNVDAETLSKFNWLLNTLKMGIPKDLVEMPEENQIQLMYEHLMVFKAEVGFGMEISSDTDLIADEINKMWKTENGETIH